MIINRKKTNSQKITKLFYKNKFYTDKASIAHQLNTHYMNVGRDLDENLPERHTNPKNYINRTFQNSFWFRGIYMHEVYDAIMGLKLLCLNLEWSHV